MLFSILVCANKYDMSLIILRTTLKSKAHSALNRTNYFILICVCFNILFCTLIGRELTSLI